MKTGDVSVENIKLAFIKYQCGLNLYTRVCVSLCFLTGVSWTGRASQLL